ncbi:MAG TPA: tetratricopeptide repeat protein [Gemmatimonadaceae bacterium]
MTDLADVTAAIEALESNPALDIRAWLPQPLRQFRFIPRVERRALADRFAAWAEADAARPTLRAYAWFFQGMDRFIDEDLRASLQLLTRARSIFTEHDDRDGLGLSAMAIGAIYRTFGNFDLALKQLWEAYELLRAAGNHPVFLAATANSLANVDLDMGHLDEARSMFQVAYDESTRADDFYFRLYALQGLARVQMQGGNHGGARPILEQALAIAEHIQHPLHISNSLTELASFEFSLGNLDEAETLSTRALAIREQHRLLAGAVTNCLRLAEIRVTQSRCEDALPVLERALSIAEDLGVKPKMAQVHHQLSQLYERTGDADKSLQHYKRFHALREEIEREDSARKLADAKTIFEAEQTRKENAIIKAQKAEIEIKNRELQDTIDELTRAKIGRKAKAMTLALAIVLFIFQDAILGTALRLLASNNYFVLLAVKMAIIFSLSPINRAIERHLLKRVARRRNEPALTAATT